MVRFFMFKVVPDGKRSIDSSIYEMVTESEFYFKGPHRRTQGTYRSELNLRFRI